VLKAAELIAASRRRVLYAGGGVVSADGAAALTQLAEALQAPVLTSPNGRGAIAEDHPLAMGPLATAPELRETLSSADVVIAIGTRFQGGATANWTLPLGAKLIHIDVDPSVPGRSYRPTLAIAADARVACDALLAAQNAQPGDREYLARAQRARDDARAGIRELIGPDHARIMDAIRRHTPRAGRIVRDATVPAYAWANRLLPILAPRTSLGTTSAAIGPGLPLAIGATVATGEPSVVIQGDGGFMLSIAELATAAQYRLPIVVCVFNDGGYGVLRMIQKMRFEGRTTGVDLHTPDFVKVAEGMGVRGAKIASAAAFESEFARAMADRSPLLLDIDMSALAPMGNLFAPPPRRN